METFEQWSFLEELMYGRFPRVTTREIGERLSAKTFGGNSGIILGKNQSISCGSCCRYNRWSAQTFPGSNSGEIPITIPWKITELIYERISGSISRGISWGVDKIFKKKKLWRKK